MLINIEKIKETVKYLKLENGLDVYIYDNKELVEYSANYVTFFGSNDLEYTDGTQDIRLPDGIAHFLEHVMFAMDGYDAFNEFSTNLASANAYTSYNQTSYIFSCNENFEKNLVNLIKMVQTPFFTKELVDKEMNIITEEIKMYAQMPEWNMRNYMFKGICNKTNYKIDIAGDVASINQIDAKMLNNIYQKFYRPTNQALIVGGDFSELDITKIINEAQIITEYLPRILPKKNVEDNILIENSQQYYDKNITNELCTYTYKFEVSETSRQNLEDYFILSCYANAYFSDNTKYFQEALKANKINQSLSYNIHVTNDIKILSFEMSIDSEANEFKEFIDRDIKITKAEFEHAYKYIIAAELRSINNRRNLVDQIASILVDEISLLEYYDVLFNIDIDYAQQRCAKLLENGCKFFCAINNESK
jgi:secreted Zn-dependent insulinase-like peptidase